MKFSKIISEIEIPPSEYIVTFETPGFSPEPKPSDYRYNYMYYDNIYKDWNGKENVHDLEGEVLESLLSKDDVENIEAKRQGNDIIITASMYIDDSDYPIDIEITIHRRDGQKVDDSVIQYIEQHK